MTDEFRVLTLNIHKGFSMSSRRLVLSQIREQLRATRANLVFLQEVVGDNEKHRRRFKQWPSDTQLEFLADTVWTHHAYCKNAIYQHGHHGNAILSEQPFVAWDNIDVSIHNFSQRGFLHGELSGGIHLICLHLGLLESERTRQTDQLVHYLRHEIDEHAPLIIAGDLNDWRKRCHRRLTEELGLQEAYEVTHGHCARTYPLVFPMLPMDRIYLRGFDVRHCDRLHGEGWRQFSDHCGLMTDLRLTPMHSQKS
jgi:endonuclease/exonuclease/phosphatase family metal-dependent hydrolase